MSLKNLVLWRQILFSEKKKAASSFMTGAAGPLSRSSLSCEPDILCLCQLFN